MTVIVYESMGKLIGGSLSREKCEKLTIRNEGGDNTPIADNVWRMNDNRFLKLRMKRPMQ